MNMLFSREWLRNAIAADPNVDVEAGIPVSTLESIGAFIPPELVDKKLDVLSHIAFARAVVQLRRRDQLTQDALAKKADIDIEEIKEIEADPRYLPRPRTIHQIAGVFNVNPRAMMKLAGATRSVDVRLSDAAMKFAAKSDAAITKLSDEENAALNDFVKALDDLVR